MGLLFLLVVIRTLSKLELVPFLLYLDFYVVLLSVNCISLCLNGTDHPASSSPLHHPQYLAENLLRVPLFEIIVHFLTTTTKLVSKWANVLDEPFNTGKLARDRIDKILNFLINVASAKGISLLLQQFSHFVSPFPSFDEVETLLEKRLRITGESVLLNFQWQRPIMIRFRT